MDRLSPDNPLADVTRTRPVARPDRLEPASEQIQDESRRRRTRRRLPLPVAVAAHGKDITLSDMLGSRSGLRRAIILSEIVGPPKALRQDE
jgi:hypothetical protein